MKKVLIVEDEILARVGLHQLINWEEEGFFLLEDAKDGREAVESIKNENPDIILLDLNIPEINGLQILKYIPHLVEPFVDWNIHASCVHVLHTCGK